MPISLPADLSSTLDAAWRATAPIPGFLTQPEARLLGCFAALAPASGCIVEIGSFKGRSTTMLATVAAHYGKSSSVAPAAADNAVAVIAIDPHNSPVLLAQGSSSFDDFQRNIAPLAAHVQVHRAFAADVAPTWNRPIRLLWIDGDHSYAGAKSDLDGFLPHLAPGGIVAFHDALHEFEGPIRVFVQDVLASPRFGPAGFVGSIAWAQLRPADGGRFTAARAALARRAGPLVPLLAGLQDGRKLSGLRKLRFKLARARVPRRAVSPAALAGLLG